MKNFTLLTFMLFFALGAAKANPDNPPKANTEPPFEVVANYYPDSRFAHSAYVRVLWGSEFYDFETQDQNPIYAWNNDTIFPWTVTQPEIQGYHGNLCLMSGNGGIENSTSSIEVAVNFVQNGSISFIGGCYGEGEDYDVCEFYIDGDVQFSFGQLQSWDAYSYEVSAGTHVFKWSYKKDGSEDKLGDAFFVDDVVFAGVSRLGETASGYNVYIQPFDAATGGGASDPTLIASNVTGNQFIVEDWADLEAGDYQFGVENPESSSAGIIWSNALNKSTVDYFTVTATVNPEIGGTVTGGGTFTYGEICTLEATANSGYNFSNWSRNDTLIGDRSKCSFTVTGDVNIVANFEPIPLEYGLYAEPEIGGEVEIVSVDSTEWKPIYYGDTITLKATPYPGYSFIKWTAEGSIGEKGGQTRGVVFLSDSPTCSVIINDDFLDGIYANLIFDADTIEDLGNGVFIEFIATFEEGIDGCLRPKQFTNTEVGPDFATFSWVEGGSAESWYIYYHNATPAPTAPEDLYVEVTENPYTLWNLDSDTPYEAYVISSCGVENGVPNSILFSDTLSFTTLGPCPTPLHVEVDSIMGCTAKVKWMDYSDSYLVQAGQPNVIINENFDNGIPSDWDNNSSYPWTVVDGYMKSSNAGVSGSTSSISITASFDADGSVEFDAECRGETGNWDHCDFFIDETLQFSIAVSDWNHYRFDVLAGEHTFIWSYTKDNSVNPTGDYFAVDNIFMIGGLSWNDSLSVEESHCTITGLDPTTMYAVHVQGICENMETEWSNLVFFTTTDACTITANANPVEGGTILGDGVYSVGDTCTLVATANPGYTFINWTKGGRICSDQESYSFIVSRDAEYEANFEHIEYYLSLSSNPEVGGIVEFVDNNSQVFYYGDTISIHAAPNPGYSFTNWSVWGGNEYVLLSTNPTYTFMIGDNNPVTNLFLGGGQISLIALFEVKNINVTVMSNPVEGGTIHVSDTVFTGGAFAYGDILTMEAVENMGYTFQNWTKNDTVVSNSQTLTVTVTETATYVANFQQKSYNISAMVSVNPTDGGTVNGAGVINYGETCTLTAVPATGYHFVKWTKNGTQVSTELTYSFVVTEEASYVAYFEINSYDISAMVSVNPTDGGTVNGADVINYGDTCTLTAVPATGYHFVKWTKNGTQVSTELTYSFVVTEEASYVAYFELDSFDISAMVSVNPTDGGTVNGAGVINYGDTCTLTAVPATGYHFVKWTKNGTQVSTELTYSFVVTEEASYVAYFEINSHLLTITYVTPAGVAAPTGYSQSYEYGAPYSVASPTLEGYTPDVATVAGNMPDSDVNVTVTYTINSHLLTITYVTPDGVAAPTGYSQSYEYGAPYSVASPTLEGYTPDVATVAGNMPDSDVNVTVTYTINSHLLTITYVTPDGVAAPTGYSQSYEYGAPYSVASPTLEGYTPDVATVAGNMPDSDVNVTVTYTINSHLLTITYVTPAGVAAPTGYSQSYEYGAPYSVASPTLEGCTPDVATVAGNMPDSDVNVTVTYTINSYAITATANPTDGGTITGANTYNHFATCTLTATPATGYHFVKWTKNGTQVSTSATYSFEVTGAAAYVAHFELNSYAITATANPTDGGTITGANTYNHFATCTLTATPATGYHFVKWTKNGTQVSTSATYSFEVTGAAAYVAHFELNSYAITATANPTDGGTITGANTYNHFATCTLTATPATGYHFVKWTKNGTQVSTSATYSFTVTEAAAYVAHFELNSYAITATANPTDGGTITGANTYNHFATCTLTATPATGYHFVKWTKNGTQVSTSATYSFTVTEAAAYVAHFELNSYAITATANPTDGGTITGAGTYNHFATCTLTATPATGYHFVKWTKNGTEVSASATYSFEVTGAASYVAHFEINGYTIIAKTNPTAGGTVTGAGNYNHGETCTLTAIPNTGYYFVKWTKGSETVSTEETYSFVVTEDATYKAHFAKIDYSISAEANPQDGGTITGTGDSFHYYTTCQLIARANTGYHFVNWTLDGVEVSTSYIYSFTVTESAHYVANFELDTFEITATADPAEGGTITGAGTYAYGQTVTLTAQANTDYRFVNWTEDGEVVSTDETITFDVDRDRHLVAYFENTVGVIEHDALTVTIYPNPVVDKLNIETSEPVKTLEIYTINGALVSKQSNCSEKIEINVDNYAFGTYMIRLTTDSTVVIRKFVKE